MTILTMIELESYCEKKKHDKQILEDKLKEVGSYQKSISKFMENNNKGQQD
jgi:hypothetical protein